MSDSTLPEWLMSQSEKIDLQNQRVKEHQIQRMGVYHHETHLKYIEDHRAKLTGVNVAEQQKHAMDLHMKDKKRSIEEMIKAEADQRAAYEAEMNPSEEWRTEEREKYEVEQHNKRQIELIQDQVQKKMAFQMIGITVPEGVTGKELEEAHKNLMDYLEGKYEGEQEVIATSDGKPIKKYEMSKFKVDIGSETESEGRFRRAQTLAGAVAEHKKIHNSPKQTSQQFKNMIEGHKMMGIEGGFGIKVYPHELKQLKEDRENIFNQFRKGIQKKQTPKDNSPKRKRSKDKDNA